MILELFWYTTRGTFDIPSGVQFIKIKFVYWFQGWQLWKSINDFCCVFYNQTLCLRPIPSLSEYFFLFFSSLNNFFADFVRIAKNGHKNFLWMILQLQLFVHSITKTMGIEILIFGNQTGPGMQRKPNFGPKIECTDDGISTKWVKILNKIILLS